MEYVYPLLKRSVFEQTYMPMIFLIPSFHHSNISDAGCSEPVEPPSNRKRGGRPRSIRFKFVVSKFIGKGKLYTMGMVKKPSRMIRIGF